MEDCSISPYLWIAFYILCLTISPYIAAQGWIQILGTHGSLWKYLAIPSLPELLYGPYGLVFLLSLQFTPVALLVFISTYQPIDKGLQELQTLARFSFWKKFHLLYLRCNKAPLLFSIVLIFWLSFWNYETPSILRQNTYALSVYAAFGSFYDYSQAIGYLLHASVYALPSLLLILWLTPSISANIRSLPIAAHTPSTLVRRLLSLLALSLIPLCGFLLPFIGLLADLDSLEFLTTTAKNYSGDIRNTFLVASCTAAIVTIICFALVYLGSRLNAYLILGLSSVILLIIPPLFTGIGAVHWFTEYGNGEAGLERIILVNILILFPILLLLASLASVRDSSSSKDTQYLFKVGPLKKFRAFLLPVFLPRILLLWGFGFLMTMREVPASLLNYPPDGSTLALTIETMLHFNQPKLISSLCIIQLGLSVTTFLAVTLLLHICKR